jgi:tetratricopeptide (TPR) repeat protein
VTFLQLATLRFELFQFLLRQESKHRLERQSPLEKLNGEVLTLVSNERFARTVDWLRKALRESPTWIEGHLLLGDESLASREVQQAYACAQAAMSLLGSEGKTSNPKLFRWAQLLLAECYLAQGLAVAAREILEELTEDGGPLRGRVTKGLAAALLLEGKEQEAAKLVSVGSGLEESGADPASRALLSYAKRKAEGGLPPLG